MESKNISLWFNFIPVNFYVNLLLWTDVYDKIWKKWTVRIYSSSESLYVVMSKNDDYAARIPTMDQFPSWNIENLTFSVREGLIFVGMDFKKLLYPIKIVWNTDTHGFTRASQNTALYGD